MPGVWVVVPAAGRGTRFGSPLPKQYLQVAGQPLIAHTLAALLSHPLVEGALVATSANDADWPGWTAFQGKPVLTCVGGDTRAQSVLAALEALPAAVRADDFVLVHDAARPNLRSEDLQQLLERGRAASRALAAAGSSNAENIAPRAAAPVPMAEEEAGAEPQP